MAESYTKGERWIKLLAAYGPVPDASAQEAEHLGRLVKRLGIESLSFKHPKEEELNGYFCTDTVKKIAVITGTAGDGKTTMCLSLIQKLSGEQADPEMADGIEVFQCIPEYGSEKITIIYDVTGWRKKTENGHLTAACVAVLEKAAAYARGTGGEAMLLAVNDGQLHEISRSLPESASEILKGFFSNILQMHSQGMPTSNEFRNTVLINLSSVPSDELMRLSLKCILEREEWNILDSEANNDPRKLFGPTCPIKANYETIKKTEIQSRLEQIAILADASGFHLPVRSIILLIVNSILGHPDFKNRLIKPGVEVARAYSDQNHCKAAFHLNFFGLNLSKQGRGKRILYQFLANLRIGLETINDIDELLIFGVKHPKLQDDYKRIVRNDEWGHQDPELNQHITKYLLGEIESDVDIEKFRDYLANERKRLFFSSSAMKCGYDFWLTSVLHYSESYIKDFMLPTRENEQIPSHKITMLNVGLNRVWTGMLVKADTRELYITTGLDLTTAPISDVLIQRLFIDSMPREYMTTKCGGPDNRLQLHIQSATGKCFVFDLTILRFEFLMRVAKGAMPTSFSKEIYSDFLALKQKAIQALDEAPSNDNIKLVDLSDDGGLLVEDIPLF